MNAGLQRSTDNVRPRRSPALVNAFTAYARRYVDRHFYAVRIRHGALPPRDLAGPLVIYLNHAAWWDPIVCLLLAREFFPARASFAPIDAAMLARYRFFRRLGFFGIEPRTAQGARDFLRSAHAVLASPAAALWLTPQGRFADVRERPLRLADGLGTLAAREPDAVFLPLAIEYGFWTESRPEILVAFGEPIAVRAARSRADWTCTFAGALEAVQDKLAASACRREPADWLMLRRGKTGVGPVYDTWRRLGAALRGRPFLAEHSPPSPT